MLETEWKAVYKDGELPQHNADGTANKYTDIDRDRLVRFVLYVDGKPGIVLHLDSRKRLIYRRRVSQQIFDKSKKEVVYLLGWQETRGGVNSQTVLFLFGDGHVEAVDGFREDHPWFYPVKFLPEERA